METEILLPLGDRVIETLTYLSALVIMIERGLAMFFENRWLAKFLSGKGLKGPVVILVSFFVAKWANFDVFVFLFDHKASVVGLILTALLIAGFSAAQHQLIAQKFGIKSKALIESEKNGENAK
ncbi:MAG: hypothetical protein HYS44_01510 [Candidatus Niyogibacteria bacterium]|nr:hypothetical protein [Candidatus Niyogibacteria bacterium]